MRTTPVKDASQFTAEESGSAVIIRLKPQILDSRLSERDRSQLNDLLAKYRQVVLDFAEVATTEGAGLNVITDWINLVQSAGRALVLAQCSRPIISILAILRISRVVPVVASLRDALAYFEAGQKALGHAG
jgi:anti-anti-sigma regulatory factor